MYIYIYVYIYIIYICIYIYIYMCVCVCSETKITLLFFLRMELYRVYFVIISKFNTLRIFEKNGNTAKYREYLQLPNVFMC